MQDLVPNRDMPVVYRDVLDGVARLERAGDRPGAYDIRRRAIAAYSHRWDDRGLQALEKLAGEAESRLAVVQRTSAVRRLTESAPRA